MTEVQLGRAILLRVVGRPPHQSLPTEQIAMFIHFLFCSGYSHVFSLMFQIKCPIFSTPYQIQIEDYYYYYFFFPEVKAE